MPAADGSLGAFNAAIDDAVQRVVATVVEVQKRIAIDAYQMLTTSSLDVGLAFGSPVLTGRYRASMRVSVGDVDTSFEPPPNAAEAKEVRQAVKGAALTHELYALQGPAYASRMLLGLEPFQTVYISDSVPYVRVIEFGGSKLKAPEGVFRVTAAALADKYAAVDWSSVIPGYSIGTSVNLGEAAE